MYSNKENINMLTALLVAHGVTKAVVCPGSRNAPIAHNLNECPDIRCYPITDERSAGFYALGMCQETGAPVVVCVTSGTALLNLAPAVAEAFYQHQPLVVVSADRPAPWIGQLDGQTLPQPDALGRFVRRAVNIPEPHDDEERWYGNRLANEALLEACGLQRGPVHINVPVSEPLFDFSVVRLPDERVITRHLAESSSQGLEVMAEAFARARCPMLVIGQTDARLLREADSGRMLSMIADYGVVLTEKLSDSSQRIVHFDELLSVVGNDERYRPDVLVYIGGVVVSKRLRHFMRKCPARTFFVSDDGSIADVTMHLTDVVQSDGRAALNAIAQRVNGHTGYHDLWQTALDKVADCVEKYHPEFSQMAVVKAFENVLEAQSYPVKVHYANSMAVRLGNLFARHYIYVNRGVNGIEGSLSVAAGMSVVTTDNVFCVVGDLSFFYDQNALWNVNLRGNLRVLLLNNGGGGIFGKFEGLQRSAARNRLVMAQHAACAQGICQQNAIVYLSARTREELAHGLRVLTGKDSDAPILLEVFTDSETDVRVMQDYYKSVTI
jgi:2-succinyl-5-enolpyruvyl-6-hydroxy-3-cyclohexene-1-carboxylate synthase